MKMSGIYRVMNKINGKVYFGASRGSMSRQKRRLFRKLRDGLHPNYIMQIEFKTYGQDAFQYDIWEVVHEHHRLLEKKQYHLNEFLKTNSRDKLYNIRRAYRGGVFGPFGPRPSLLEIPEWVPSSGDLSANRPSTPIVAGNLQ